MDTKEPVIFATSPQPDAVSVTFWGEKVIYAWPDDQYSLKRRTIDPKTGALIEHTYVRSETRELISNAYLLHEVSKVTL